MLFILSKESAAFHYTLYSCYMCKIIASTIFSINFLLKSLPLRIYSLCTWLIFREQINTRTIVTQNQHCVGLNRCMIANGYRNESFTKSSVCWIGPLLTQVSLCVRYFTSFLCNSNRCLKHRRFSVKSDIISDIPSTT